MLRGEIVAEIIAKSKKRNKKPRRLPPRQPSGIVPTFNTTSVLEPLTSSQIEGPQKNTNSQNLELDFSAYSPNESKFVSEYLRYGNSVHAAMKAYSTKDHAVAAQIASHLMRKLKPSIVAILETHDVDMVSLINTVKAAQNAKKYAKTDTVGEFKEVPDHPTRLKAVELIGKWTGLSSPTVVNPNIQINNIIGGQRKKYDI
jgi:dihydroorotate dehydrogenase